MTFIVIYFATFSSLSFHMRQLFSDTAKITSQLNKHTSHQPCLISYPPLVSDPITDVSLDPGTHCWSAVGSLKPHCCRTPSAIAWSIWKLRIIDRYTAVHSKTYQERLCFTNQSCKKSTDFHWPLTGLHYWQDLWKWQWHVTEQVIEWSEASL